MGVDVDEARGDEQAPGVDFFLAFAGHLPNGGDLAAFYRDVAVEKGRAAAVRDAGASD